MLRLVLLTGDGPEHRWVARALSEAFPRELRAIVLADPPPRPRLARWKSYARRYTARQLLSRAAAKVHARASGRSARMMAAAHEVLGLAEGSGAMPRPDLVRVVPAHNGPECLALLADIKPDIIGVYGTAVIREGVMRAAGTAILNMHTGISPRYRGADSVFWALHNSEPEWIGATVHLLTPGLDAGPILFTGRPVLAPDDDEAALFFKAVAVGARLYVEAVRALANGTARPVPQRLEEGREYRFVHRTVAAELRVRRLLAHGLLRRYAAATEPAIPSSVWAGSS